MSRKITAPLFAASLVLITSSPGIAGPREEQLDKYASAARAANPAFAGFSAARGKALHTQAFAGGKPDTPACTSCHGNDTRGAGAPPPSTGLAIGSLVTGIIALLLSLIPVIGFISWILAPAGLIMGILAVNKPAGKGLAIGHNNGI